MSGLTRGSTITEQDIHGIDQSTGEVLATTGLVTMLGAVVAAVMAFGALGQGSAATAGVLGVVAILSFGVSVVCFAADSNRSDDARLPFPSWLRTESGTAAELSAPPVGG
jgi:hypothetical protein